MALAHVPSFLTVPGRGPRAERTSPVTGNSNLKRDIRARMAVTGETYVVARRAVLAPPGTTPPGTPGAPDPAQGPFEDSTAADTDGHPRRTGIVGRLFDAAAETVRYPAGAEDIPGTWVLVPDWDGDQPCGFTLAYPTRWDATNRERQETVENRLRRTVGDRWQFVWDTNQDRLVCVPPVRLPTVAALPDTDLHPWDRFPLGIATENGTEAFWRPSVDPHMLLVGPAGSGKSVTQRNILLHALQSPDWRVTAIDVKRVELDWLRGLDNVLEVASDLKDGVGACENVKREMMRRYERMESEGVSYFTNLKCRPPALLLMVDETFAFLSPEGIESDEGKARDELHARGAALIGLIAQSGRAAGVHLVLATQRTSTTVLKSELKNNLDCRIAAGRMDTIPSLMVLGSEAAARLPKIRGRGLVRSGSDEPVEFQGYLLPVEDVDGWLARQRELRATGT